MADRLDELTATDLAKSVLRRIRGEAERALGPLRDVSVTGLAGGGLAVLAVDTKGGRWLAGRDPRPITSDPQEWLLVIESFEPWHKRETWTPAPRDTGRIQRSTTPPNFVSKNVRTISAQQYIRRKFAAMGERTQGMKYTEMLGALIEPRQDDTLRQRMVREAMSAIVATLDEGVFDPYILKAVFLGGGGGSGKGFISNIMFGTMNIPGGASVDTSLTAFGLKSLNADDIFSSLLRKADIPLANVASPEAQAIRAAKVDPLEHKRREMWIGGRLGLIIDGTAKDPSKVRTQKQILEDLGYDTYMVFVDTALDVAIQRNKERAEKGDRLVPEEILRKAHAQAQSAKAAYSALFGKNALFIDNSKRLSPQEVITELTPKLHRAILKFISEPLKNQVGKAWLDAMVQDMPPEMLKLVTWIGKKQGR
jgi:predicted kinase